jgi:hypothetical protein
VCIMFLYFFIMNSYILNMNSYMSYII